MNEQSKKITSVTISCISYERIIQRIQRRYGDEFEVNKKKWLVIMTDLISLMSS